MRRIFATLLAIFGILGCAQKNPITKNFSIKPVTHEESQLIRLRLASGEILRPYEQIELGSSGSLRNYKNEETDKGLISFFNSTETSGNSTDDLWGHAFAGFMKNMRQSSLEYFKNYPGDQVVFWNVQSNIPENRCFNDGFDTYCGPGLLSGFMFLLDPGSWRAFHDWLTAIAKAMIPAGHDDVSSAAFQDFVRYFDFGIFKRLEINSPFLKESVCHRALKQLDEQLDDQLESVGEHLSHSPRDWEINPCRLVFAHKKGAIMTK